VYSLSSPELKQDIRLYQELIHFRDVRLEWLTHGCVLGIPLLNEISSRLGTSFEETIYLMPFEIKEGLSGKKVNLSEIRERLNKYALVMEEGIINLYTGEEVETHRVGTEVKEKDHLKGMSASQGKVIGKVKIIKDRTQLHRLEEGDILITKLTTPDFVMAMGKAAAIVTDIGGLTSHAAIVSRELAIPCVVGTETATKTFKDGDLIEVDATNGIVRKIQ
jgi:phosphoenolpyruvate synthase/pyruvate phosphate dikinase